jgi:hypothetical protein
VVLMMAAWRETTLSQQHAIETKCGLVEGVELCSAVLAPLLCYFLGGKSPVVNGMSPDFKRIVR